MGFSSYEGLFKKRLEGIIKGSVGRQAWDPLHVLQRKYRLRFVVIALSIICQREPLNPYDIILGSENGSRSDRRRSHLRTVLLPVFGIIEEARVSFGYVSDLWSVRGEISATQIWNATEQVMLPFTSLFKMDRLVEWEAWERRSRMEDIYQTRRIRMWLRYSTPESIVFTAEDISTLQAEQASYNMPKAPKTAVKNEEDIKPYAKDTDAPTSPQKSSKKSTGEAWTPEQMWALFNAIYTKGLCDPVSCVLEYHRDENWLPRHGWVRR
jgi:hypothetical protein